MDVLPSRSMQARNEWKEHNVSGAGVEPHHMSICLHKLIAVVHLLSLSNQFFTENLQAVLGMGKWGMSISRRREVRHAALPIGR